MRHAPPAYDGNDCTDASIGYRRPVTAMIPFWKYAIIVNMIAQGGYLMFDSYCSRKYHDKGLTDDELTAWIHSVIGNDIELRKACDDEMGNDDRFIRLLNGFSMDFGNHVIRRVLHDYLLNTLYSSLTCPGFINSKGAVIILSDSSDIESAFWNLILMRSSIDGNILLDRMESMDIPFYQFHPLIRRAGSMSNAIRFGNELLSCVQGMQIIGFDIDDISLCMWYAMMTGNSNVITEASRVESFAVNDDNVARLCMYSVRMSYLQYESYADMMRTIPDKVAETGINGFKHGYPIEFIRESMIAMDENNRDQT